ncbi:SCO family protein [Mesorhizobium sp.]|uniref:SCO family protein n=1 Tax=Mesorhizobium sp. TaxID=1871066 RepID=UPI00257AA962|nr:SCO family protein [Mesorhizobium sp.]
MKRRHGLLSPWAYGPHTLFCIMFAAALSICQPLARADTPVTVGGSFTLTAPDGTTVTDETYRGKWLLVFFGYTSCPDICPTTLSSIAAAIEELGPDAAKLQPLFITVDPERDTPEVMGSFTAAFDPRIVGLTGSPQQIAAVSEAYGAYGVARRGEAGGDDYLMDHGTHIYIMNPQGQFVEGLDSDTPSSGIAARLGELVR